MSMEHARTFVATGVALLDKEMPGWHDRIDVEKFAIESAQRCALGQLYPESEVLPRWQSMGFASLNDAVEQSISARTAKLSNVNEIREARRELYSSNVCTANYELGRVKLGLDDEQARLHGFNQAWAWSMPKDHPLYDAAVAESDDDELLASYAELDSAWTEVILSRRAETLAAVDRRVLVTV